MKVDLNQGVTHLAVGQRNDFLRRVTEEEQTTESGCTGDDRGSRRDAFNLAQKELWQRAETSPSSVKGDGSGHVGQVACPACCLKIETNNHTHSC